MRNRSRWNSPAWRGATSREHSSRTRSASFARWRLIVNSRSSEPTGLPGDVRPGSRLVARASNRAARLTGSRRRAPVSAWRSVRQRRVAPACSQPSRTISSVTRRPSRARFALASSRRRTARNVIPPPVEAPPAGGARGRRNLSQPVPPPRRARNDYAAHALNGRCGRQVVGSSRLPEAADQPGGGIAPAQGHAQHPPAPSPHDVGSHDPPR